MSYSYDANDRLSTDTYDNDGNTISSGSTANTYDFENRMLTHGAVSIAYDGDGNRVSETVGGTTTKYLVDTLNPTHLPQVLDEVVNGFVTRTYAYGLQRISENQQISGTWTPSFYGYDGHGNVRFLTNSAGAITDTYTYDAFGMQIARTGTTPNVFQYTGEWLDSNLGLYYLRARYLNQATGRFWSRDPVEGKKCCGLSWNPYIYVKQNPVNEIDPTGRDYIEYLAGVLEESVAVVRATATIVRTELFEECLVGEVIVLRESGVWTLPQQSRRPPFIAARYTPRYRNRSSSRKAVWPRKMSFMESRSSYDVEKLLAAVRAFERVIELSEQLCQGGDRLARLLGVFFAMTVAFAIRASLAIGERDLPEMAADTGADGSGSDAEQQSVPILNTVRAAIPRLVAAVTSSNSAATVSALEEMGVFALCPNPGEQLSRL
jgi:RHS repeat-associated protein